MKTFDSHQSICGYTRDKRSYLWSSGKTDFIFHLLGLHFLVKAGHHRRYVLVFLVTSRFDLLKATVRQFLGSGLIF